MARSFSLKRTVAKGTRRRSGTTFVQASRRVSPTEKAVFHNVTGAGRSRIKREFFGLSPDDEVFIVNRLQQYIEQQLG